MASRLSRRDFARAALSTAGVAATTTFLGACESTQASPAAGGSRTPKRGGTLRVAIAGGGAAESLNPYSGTSPIEFARNRVVYDLLFAQADGKTVARLATKATPAADGRSVDVTIRDGVRWHDGSPFTVDDVLFTLRTALDPKLPYPNELAHYVDPAKTTAVDKRTVRLSLRRPVGDPAALLAVSQTFVIKTGTRSFDVGNIVGTGPFRVDSFQPGRSAGLRRFDGHWDGAPYLDRVTFLSLGDPNARVNVVLSGQADYATAVPYSAAKTLPSGRGVEVRTAGERDRTGYGFVFNTTRPPFDSPEVRMAVRMAVDRQALVDTVFLGYGVPGNDLFGAGSVYFAGDIKPPRHDVAEARRLIAAAGADRMDIIVRSAEIEAGDNASATLLVEQLKGIGLRCTTQVVGPAQFGDIQAMGNANIVVISMGAYPLQTVYTQLSLIPPLAFSDQKYRQAIATALATPDEGTRTEAWRAAQHAQSDRGNLLVWGFGDTLSIARSSLRGVSSWGTAKYPYFGKAWLA